MDKKRQYVIFAGKSFDIILEEVRVHHNAFTGNQPGNIFLKSVLIHVDVGHERFRGRSLFPIRLDFSGIKSLHHGIGIVDRMPVSDSVSVVPFLHGGKVPSMQPAQFLYFLLREAHIYSKVLRIQHGIFLKIRDCGLRTVFFYRKDSCHISGRNSFRCEIVVFKPSPEQVQISSLSLFVGIRFSDDGVPLVKDKNDFFPRSVYQFNQHII